MDIENSTFGISATKLQNYLDKICIRKNNETYNKFTGRKIAAILPVHIFGNPADILLINSVAKRWNLPIVEDAAEALGSWRKKRKNLYIAVYLEKWVQLALMVIN